MSAAAILHPLAALLVVFATMAGETARSVANERTLLARGAHVVADPSYPWMRLAYPLGFLAVCVEGWARGAPATYWSLAGKLIKYAAISTLGPRWSFRVLVLPGDPLVSHGIYRLLRHPNYVGVAGEVLGIALWMQAPITGTLFAVTFGVILLWRIRIEERALGLPPRA
jgi:methyltransferase